MCCKDDFGDEEILSIRPYKSRSCTDILFLLAFVGFWGATIVVAYVAMGMGGNPQRIIRGTDMNGQICGISSSVKDRPLVAWPNPACYEAMWCVADCNFTQSDTEYMSIHYETEKFLTYCLPTIASEAIGAILPNSTSSSSTNSSNNDDDSAIEMSPAFSSAAAVAQRAVGDIFTAGPIIGASVAIALVVAFLYTMCVKKFAGCLVWSMFLFILLGGLLAAYALLDQAAKAKENPNNKDTATALQYAGYIMLALAVIFVLMIIFLRQRIKIAIEVVKEASRALGAMPLLVCFPGLPFVVAIGYLAFWIVVALYIYSVSTPEDVDITDALQFPQCALLHQRFYLPGGDNNLPTTLTQFKWDEQFKKSFALHFFGLLWNLNFLIYFGYMVIAGAVADWYFTPRDAVARENIAAAENAKRAGKKEAKYAADEPEGGGRAWTDAPGRKLSSTPILDSCLRVFRFHLGTIALASLIIAIIQFIRAVVKYIEEKSKKKDNKLRRAIFCIIQCCLKCVEKCMDKISKNALIWTSVWGDGFCMASCKSFALLWENLGRVAAINMVGMYLIVLGKILVALITTGICAIIFVKMEPYMSHLSTPVVPCVLIFIIAYAVGSLFMVVYETTIDTIFLCFLIDDKKNRGKTMLASRELQTLVHKYKDASKKVADAEKAPPGP